jgi:hypothetical protein
MRNPTKPLYSNGLPRWPGILVSALAAAGALATFMLGVLIFVIHLQPDTGHGEDIGVPIAIAALLPFLVISAFLGVGAAMGGFALSTGRARLAPVAAIVLTLVGVSCAVAAR